MAQDHTRPSDATRKAESQAAGAAHDADRPASPEEEELAGSHAVDPEVSEAYQEANERGAAQQGEGKVP